MRLTARLSGLVRTVVVVATVIFAALLLVVGQGEEAPLVVVEENRPSPETFTATEAVNVTDEAATAAARDAARNAVQPVFSEDPDANEAVLSQIQAFFDDVEEVSEPIPPEDTEGLLPPDTTEGTVAEGDTTETTGEESTTTEATTTTEAPATTETTAVGVETTEVGTDTTGTTDLEAETTTTSSTTTTTTLPPPPREEQILVMRELHPTVSIETIQAIVDLRNDDLIRDQAGDQMFLRFAEEEALQLATETLEQGILAADLLDVKSDLVSNPPRMILLRDLPDDDRDAAETAIATLVATFLIDNRAFDEQATEDAREEAAASVPDVTVSYVPGQLIVAAGELVNPVQLEAIQQLELLQPAEEPPPLRALAASAALVTLIAAFYLWRIGRRHWQQPKLVALFGMMIVLAAATARVPELITRDRLELGFLIPAALFGYLAANLFDSRVAVLMAVPVGAFTALGTGDLALTVYAAAATLLPIPLVSAISTRTQLNLAVVYSAVLHAPLAAAISWWFNGQEAIVWSTVFGVAGGVIAGVVALGVLPFLSSLFGITTTQTLLDLTDRNHPALRLIEEEAPGTFNHSIVVGNLAGKAARAIDGNPLLAQAMAYYHDLGKTVSPQYFVENQFGVSNPHDALPPPESAAIIRSHVAEGLRLARQFRIPPDVSQGILTHHGTSLMRYFYHKALDRYGDEDVNPLDYRHRGRKPRTKEMVIVMMADATEAATRSMVQNEDPTSEGIRKLVEQIIAEKVEDGQLEDSEVTFGELTRIKEAFVDALIGYYHTRIAYPGFPTAGSTAPA
jgi:putative nucleotidyltransferase with HDIG domain